MNDGIKKKLPQNIQHLLMEIGEKSVLFKLFLLVKDTEWDVFQNLGEAGCDLLLINNNTNVKIKIEVKTRQRLYSTSDEKKLNTVQYTLTENEYKNCDFAICYWFEENAYFIVPKSELIQTSSKGKLLYKFITRRHLDGSSDEKSKLFLNNWSLVLSKRII